MITLGMFGLSACTQEADPRKEIEDAYRELRVDSAMGAAEYQHTSELLHHPPMLPEGASTQPTLQAATSNRVYNLTYANYATVTIGGVAYNNSISNWMAGASAGNVPIDPVAFSQLNAALSHQVRMLIGDNPIPWWPSYALRPITFTLLDKGNYVLSGGLYTMSTNNYLYMGDANGGGGQVGSTSCGAITYSALHGYMNPGYGGTNGYFSYNIIAGCSPVVVTATVQFFFTGVAM
ncbi:MAG: hypothetical protein U0176_12895 [Bacteroidia bacterium]